uniref:Serpentine receptor class gamma n=1 Tax=Parastrongyloides trichosuri TaxID=131310 RepID=A0A0N4ZAN4_PARTI
MTIPIYDAIFLGFQCVCYIIYIMLALIFINKMVSGKDRKNEKDFTSFKIHFIINTFYDILQAFAVLIFQKFLHWNIWIEFFKNNLFTHILYAPVLYMSILGSIIGGCIIVINRYCALVHPIFFKQRWNIKVSLTLVGIQVILPIFSFSHNFFYNSKVNYYEILHIHTFDIADKAISQLNNVILSFFSGIVCFITLSLNIILLHRYGKLIEGLNKNEKSKKTYMFFYSLATTLCLFLLFAEQVIRLIFGLTHNDTGIYILTYVLYWIIPTFTCLQPILILTMSKEIRRQFILTYFSFLLPKSYYSHPVVLAPIYRITTIKRTIALM